ncbi:protein trunk-like [Littorina saxatilis]
MPSGYFDDGSALQSNLPLPATRVSDTDRSSSPYAVAKRKPESATVEHNPAHTAGDDDDDHDDNNDNTDDAPISVESRSSRCNMPDLVMGNNLPWTCQQRFSWRYLGEHIYPSRLSEVACEGSQCWHGHYNCTPILYTLSVLEFCLNGCFDQRVPSPLRSRWRWLDLNVTVGCQCVR